MSDQDPTMGVPRFGDPRQERIHRRLLIVGSGPDAFYRDAVRIMAEEPALEATVHLVAHLLREIEGAIRKVLLPHEYVPAMGSEKSHREGIEAILKAYGVEDSDPVAAAWRRLSDHEEDVRHEPPHGLAPFLVTEVFRLIERFKAEGIAVLVIEQNARKALGSRRLRLCPLRRQGFVLEGPTASLRANDAVVHAYLRAQAPHLSTKGGP